jgi:hypothetical protein
MSQVVANLFQRQSLRQKMSRTRVPKSMRPVMPDGRLEGA